MTPSHGAATPGRRLRWTELAADDLEAITDYLGERAPESAARIVREIVTAFNEPGRNFEQVCLFITCPCNDRPFPH